MSDMTVPPTKHNEPVGTFQQLVLAAVLSLRDNASAFPVHEKVEELADRRFYLSAVYTTLARLEKKGYLQSSWTKPMGGKKKRCYELTASGAKAAQESAEIAKRVYAVWEKVFGKNQLEAASRESDTSRTT